MNLLSVVVVVVVVVGVTGQVVGMILADSQAHADAAAAAVNVTYLSAPAFVRLLCLCG
jgi:xanthine dehydrogenase molybdopterin-binding subunit B